MPEIDTDLLRELLEQARRGDAGRKERLFEVSRAFLSQVAPYKVPTYLQAKGDASDLIQQTLLEAFRDFDNFDGTEPEQWLAWLRRMLGNNATDHVRRYQGADKRRVGRELSLGEVQRGAPHSNDSPAEDYDPVGWETTPSKKVSALEEEARLLASLKSLPSDYQTVIQLRNFDKLSFEQVAQRMGRSRPAVQMLWMRALRNLQEHLEKS